MEDDAQATASIDWSAISKVYHNLPVIFLFLVKWAKFNKEFSAHELIQLYKVCHDIAWLLQNDLMKKRVYGCFGDLYYRISRFKDSMDCFKEFLELCKRPYDEQGTARAHFSIGNVHLSRGKYKEAMECFKKYLKICQQTGDLTGEGWAHNGIGAVHRSRGENKEAMECFKKNLKICQQTGYLVGEGVAHNNIGCVHHSRGEYKEAMKCYKKNLKICQQKDDLAGEGVEHHNIGTVHKLRGEYKKAMEFYKKNLKICQQKGNLAREGEAHQGIGTVHNSRGKYKEAMECFKKKLKICQQTGDLVGKAGGFFNIGALCLVLLDLSAAESHLKESLLCYEKVFSNLSNNDMSKVSIVDTYIRAYQLLTFVLVKVDKIKEALLISERGRSQALRDKLLDKYQIESKDFSTVVDYSDVSSLISSNDSTFLIFSLSPFEPRLYTFFVSMKEKESCKGLSKDNLASIVKNCPDKEIESILDSFVTKIIEHANEHVHENRENTFEDRSMGQDDADVCEQEQLTRDSNTPQQEHQDMNTLNCVSGEDLLKYLYQALIAPINNQLVQPEIVIIPDGPLFLLPFAVLQSPDGQFLSDTKRIRIGPSLTTLKLLKEYPVEKQSKTGALIVGGPIVRNVMYRGGFRKGFGDLPGAWEEATEIGKILDETPLTKESATKEEVMRRLQEGVAVIHIATHGDANTGELLLAPAPHIYQHHIPTEEDYMLTIKDISACKINAQLVVLSCCHSGRGQVRAEGVVGLTRAFLAAGARSVLGALWEISDAGTLFFMTSFYGHLKRGESACTSLQEAMREMRGHPRWSHPYYWGSFFIVGHDVTI